MFYVRTEQDEGREKETKAILDKVRKKYPEIKGEIEVQSLEEDCFTMYVELNFMSKSYIPKLVVSTRWDKFSKEEKEAIIAHELGHVIQRNKNRNPLRSRRLQSLYIGFNLMMENKMHNKSNEYSKRDRFLEKYKTLMEMHTDKELARRGYGEGMLKFLKTNTIMNELKHLEGTQNYEIGKRITKARINNLEKILENEKTI